MNKIKEFIDVDNYIVKKADVLVIGGGGAGMKAAIDLSNAGNSVFLVAKGPLTKTGITPIGNTGLSAYIGECEDDSCYKHFQDIIIGGKFLSNQKLVRVMTERGKRVIDELRSYGVVFETNEDGRMLQIPVSGMSAPRMNRIRNGGTGLTKGLEKEVRKHSSIDVWEDTIILELVFEKGRIIGALGLSLKDNSCIFFASKSTILATGGNEQLWAINDCPSESVGDGYVLAFRVGAKLIDMEMQLFYPTVIIEPNCLAKLVFNYEHFGRPGCRLIDVSGRAVIHLTSPLPNRDEMARMIAEKIEECPSSSKNNGLFVDISRCPESEKKIILDRLPTQQLHRIREFIPEFPNQKQMIKVAPASHTTLGGVEINEKAQTSINGLFACGEVAGNVHGANRLAGSSYLDIIAFGSIAAESASNFASQDREFIIPSDKFIKKLFLDLFQFNVNNGGDKPRYWKVRERIQSTIGKNLGVIRKKEGMQEALNKIHMLRKKLPQYSVPISNRGYNLDLIEFFEVKSMLEIAEIVIVSALYREESRGAHYRKDFPYMDNDNWLFHTIIQRIDGNLNISRKKVEIDGLFPKEGGNIYGK